MSIPINESLLHHAPDIMSQDLFDTRLSQSVFPSADRVIAGSFDDNFHMINLKTGDNMQYTINDEGQTVRQSIGRGKPKKRPMNLSRRVMCSDRSPVLDCFVVSSECMFFTYGKVKRVSK